MNYHNRLEVIILSEQGLSVQEIAYRLSLEITAVNKIVCSASFVDSKGKIVLKQ